MKRSQKSCIVLMIVAALIAAALVFPAGLFAAEGYTWVTQVSGTPNTLFGVTAVDTSHVWAIGQNHTIAFYDGTGWATQTNPATGSFFNDIDALDLQHVWAVGPNHEILFNDGTGWTTQVAADMSGQDYYSVDALDANNAWAVGQDGSNNDVIYRFDGTNWTSESMGQHTNLRSVSALDADHVWACGYDQTTNDGRIYFRDRTHTWNATPQATTSGKNLRSIWAADPGHNWAVGASGTILRFDGANWSADPQSGIVTTDDLYSVSGLDANHVWACGNNGTILFYNGSTWTMQTPATANSLRGIAPVDVNHVWLAGRLGTIVYGESPAVSITSIAPTSGPVGAEVTITGMNFGAAQGVSMVTFHGFDGIEMLPTEDKDMISWSDTQVKCLVPEGAYSGLVRVTTPTGGTSNGLKFTVTQSKFYFAEGTCRPNFDTYFSILNNGESDANVKLTYQLGNGGSQSQELVVPKQSRATVAAKATVGEGDDPAHDFSTIVETTNKTGILVERPMYFNYKGAWTGGHDVFGATSPGTTYYFAEGTTRPNFESYFCLQNAGTADASVKITYMLGDGTNKEETLNVATGTRATIDVNKTLDQVNGPASDFSAKVESTNGVPILAERPMYFNYKGAWTGGHDVVGASATAPAFYFAEGSTRPGFEPYFCIQNPGDTPANIKITYMMTDGTTNEEFLTVPAKSRATVDATKKLGVADDATHDFSAKVECTNGQNILAERPMYFKYKGAWTGGHDVVGATTAGLGFGFAEGTCRPGFEPYFCIQNPGTEDAAVKITYMTGDGTMKEQVVAVSALSRSTVPVKDLLGEGNDPAHDFSANVESTNKTGILVERPMYFNYRPGDKNWNGGHDVIGFAL